MINSDQAFKKVLAQENYWPSQEPSSEEQEHFLSGFSWGAFVYSYFYFRAMRDPTFGVLSALAVLSFILLPVQLILPFLARRRAWEKREWVSYWHFKEVQQKWDRAALVGCLFIFVSGYLFYRVSLGYLNGLLKTVDPNLDINHIDPALELNKIQQNLNDELGQ